MTPRPCPECPTGRIYDRFGERCASCWAKRFLGISHLPRSHEVRVLDPDGRETVDRDAVKEET